MRFLCKFHLWSGNAIYRYDLLEGGCVHFDGKALWQDNKTVYDWLEEATTNGYEVEHPRRNDDMDVKRVDDWIAFGRNAASQISLEVGE